MRSVGLDFVQVALALACYACGSYLYSALPITFSAVAFPAVTVIKPNATVSAGFVASDPERRVPYREWISRVIGNKISNG